MSDLKSKRVKVSIEWDEYYYVDKDKHPTGNLIECKDILSWIEAQRKQFGMNDEKILKQLVEELS